MPNENGNFSPDWVSPPGDTIAAILNERGVTRDEFGKWVQLSHAEVDHLIAGTTVITASLATLLAEVLGSTPSFWKKREARYRQGLQGLEREGSSPGSLEWLGNLPAREMADLGWIRPTNSKATSVAACLQFFGVPDVPNWRNAYKDTLDAIAFRSSKAFASRPGAVVAWLRQGEIIASDVKCDPWDPKRFRHELECIRVLTREEDPADFLPELARRCATCGVALVVLRAPKGCKASGAVRFLPGDKPMLMLSGRHLSDDHFWFTFYHEAGHLILHAQRLIIEVSNGDDALSDQEEGEADTFAGDLLVPPEHQPEMLRLKANKIDVIRFARRIGVSRGVVVGQLQHRGIIRRDQLNGLKHWFHWDDA